MFSKKLRKQRNVFKKLVALLLIVTLSITSINYKTIFANSNSNTTDSTTELTKPLASAYSISSSFNVAPTANIGDGAILQAFCWSFNTIKANMKDIANAGYTSIQTSPINAVDESYPYKTLYSNDKGTGGSWWWHYQPTDWTIGNYQVGTRDEFKSMCAEADKYGIKIIVDVVPNHTAGNQSKVSSNLRNAAGGNLYHDTGFIKCTNYADRFQCTLYSMDGGLPDVDTENKGFQDYFIKFLNDSIACGADGFRYDTAKHIGLPDDDRPSWVTNNFWSRVTSEITNAGKIFNYGEVLQDTNDRFAEYAKAIGSTTASKYGGKIRGAITSNNLSASNIMSYEVPSGVDTSDLVTWVESHDNYINDGTWSQLNDEQVKLGWAVITARKDGAPLFFSRPNGGGPSNKWGTNTIGIAGSDLYKDDEVAAVNKFRNAMVGQGEYLANPNGDTNVLMIQRGTIGAVIVNSKYSDYYINASTQLQDGTYYSITDDNSKFVVSNKTITGTIPKRSSVVLIYGGIASAPSVSLDNYKSTFSTDSIAFTLRATNTTSSSYKVNSNASVSYKDGAPLTIGAGDAVGTQYTITLTGVGSDGSTVTQTYTTKKVEQGVGTTIYFEKPSSWSDTIYAYVYDESGTPVKEVKAWPGTAMQKESSGLYSLTYTETYSSPLVIFNDTVNQSPGSKVKGFAVEDKATYDINGKKNTDTGTNSITIYYKTSWSTANIHYKIGSGTWTTVPGVAMTDSKVSGYKTITIDLGTNTSLTACFNNGNNTWDNNSTKNYTFTSPGTYTVKDGNVTSGEPANTNSITVYYYTSWSSSNIHYQIGSGSWTSVPGVRMSTSSLSGYKVITIDLGTNSTLTCCFNDSNNNWDNNSGNNYYLGSTGTYTIKNGTITKGTP